MNIVNVEEVTKVYDRRSKRGGILALDEASLSVKPGEILGLLGPNGAGKTTMFKILLGITGMTGGSAMISGLPPSDPKSRARLGYLPENHRFPSHLTGFELLELTGRLYGLKIEDIRYRSEELVEMVGLDKRASGNIAKYSKGMQQRLALAQALIADPDILLLDEPTDGVDPLGKIDIRNVLIRLRDQGKAVILNSHMLSEVESVADRIVILARGKVVREGPLEELTSRKSQYEIEADIGNRLITISEEIGKVISVASSFMLVQLEKPENINHVIDLLRMKKISIKSVKPMKISLEQSFLETVSKQEAKN